ncbi:Josephin-domain-containing protein, partial [Paraphysoderma sedebokerense]
QEGSLCAQHALNSLLQGPYFTAVDLSEIARELDAKEMQEIAKGSASDYEQYLKEGSSNFDDSGFFSVQVIQSALKVWNLELISYASEAGKTARDNPHKEIAYICNQSEHWYTIRRFHKRWYNLNSTQSKPTWISETYLHMLLSQAQLDGYSIFIVRGILPPSSADEIAMTLPDTPPPELASPTSATSQSSEKKSFSGQGYKLSASSDSQNGINAKTGVDSIDGITDEDLELSAAIAASLADAGKPENKEMGADELRRLRLARFG